jgi:hypothetical protein
MPLHSGLTGASLHECKGVAAASAGDVQVADGAGSATWGDFDYRSMPTGALVQQARSTLYTTYTSTTTAMPSDNTIPQNTEGVEIATVTITPKATTHILVITAFLQSQSAADQSSMAIFQDSTANAIAACMLNRNNSSNLNNCPNMLIHYMTAGTTSATTFKLRAGPDSGGTLYINGGSSERLFGGVAASWIKVEEFKA